MGSLEYKMFKKILLCLFVALVTCQSDESNESMESMEMEDSETRSGLCMEDEEVMYWCTVGTPLGEKLSAAMMTCSGAEEAEGRKKGNGKKCKGKGKGKGKKCFTVEEVEAWFMEEFAGELCVFSELGWLDEAGNYDNVTAEADLMTLPSNVSAAVSQENMEQCMGKVLQEMSEDKKVKKCVESGKYTEEDLGKLQELAKATAGMKCFVNMFQKSCNNFVGEQIYQALYLNTLAG